MKSSIAIFSLIALFLFQCKTSQLRETPKLANTQWVLEEMNGVPVLTPDGREAVHFILSTTDDRMSGFAGCNRMSGGYTLDGAAISFQVAATKMMCLDQMDVEDFFLGVLTNTNAYKLSDGILQLLQDSSVLATFRSNP